MCIRDRLSALDPLRVLARGYSVTYVEGTSAPLVDAEGVAPGDALRIVLARGTVRARVTDISKDGVRSVSYTHLRAHETVLDLLCRLLLETKNSKHS